VRENPIEERNNNPARRAYVRMDRGRGFRRDFVLYSAYSAVDTVSSGTSSAIIGPFFTAANTMRLFMKHDLFIRTEVANATFFKPNLENDETVKLFEFLEVERRKVFFSRNKTIARLLKKYADTIIERSGKRIQLLVLFGSVARGEWTKNSDVDILAVAPDRFCKKFYEE
jgi:hypothetical protein